MKITFIGAVREVTGSMYLLEEGNTSFLVDCGMFQGRSEARNSEGFLFDPREIKFVLLTHAHLDHSGRIPLLVKRGFSGKIYTTYPTAELVKVLWRDTVKLMKEESEWKNRKRRRAGKPEVLPLYDERDVENAEGLLEAVPYDEVIGLGDQIRARFRDAGHILGSGSVELWSKDVKVVFSGDIGSQKNGIEGAPAFLTEADYVVIESTYGDRLHKGLSETREEFREAILNTVKIGKVLIPSFVVDRAQRIIYELALMRAEGLFPEDVPVFFDSPMGKAVTDIYKDNKNLLSAEVLDFMERGYDPFSLEGLKYITSVEDSKRINEIERAVVIAGSGMCSGGRIVHHLKHNLWKEDTSVIFVGYQAAGTLGRRMVEGAKSVRIMGEDVQVAASIHTINGFSAHADSRDLLNWAEGFDEDTVFFVTHGEEKASLALANSISNTGGQAVVPTVGQSFELDKRRIEKTENIVRATEGDLINNIVDKVMELKNGEIICDNETEPLLKTIDMLLDIIIQRQEEM